MSLIPTTSLLFRDLVGTESMREIWTDHAMIASWMQVERAIVETQAEMGMVPDEAARAIVERLRPEVVTADRIVAKKTSIGHLFVSFLKACREACGEAAEHLHVGPTTQDILDTGLALQLRDSHRLLYGDALTLEEILCDVAERHANVPMMGRTHEQHAVPVTFGFVVAGWAVEMRDHLDRMRECEARWMIGNVSGAVGAHNAFVELAGEAAALELERRVCARLALASPMMPLHARIDRFSEFVERTSELVGFLGRVGATIRSMQRTEVGEVEEPYGDAQHWSSTMPNKKNPETAEQLIGLATLCRSFAQSMKEIRMADYRDTSRLPVEVTAIPGTCLAGARAIESAKTIIGGLVVNADRMVANLDDPRSPGHAAAERVMIALYKKTGRRDAAHELMHRCSREAREQRLPLARILENDDELRESLSKAEIDSLCDLTTYTGTSAVRTRDAVAHVRGRHAADVDRFEAGAGSTTHPHVRQP